MKNKIQKTEIKKTAKSETKIKLNTMIHLSHGGEKQEQFCVKHLHSYKCKHISHAMGAKSGCLDGFTYIYAFHLVCEIVYSIAYTSI